MGVSWNPYLEEWASARALPVGEANRQQIRTHLTRKYAFGVPGAEALECLARYAPIVEMGAGIGYWARCLRERGVDVVAYDEMGDSWRAWFRKAPERGEPVLWTEVRQGRPEVLAQHADRTLLLCWPDPWSGFDARSLLAYRGKRLALVGEPSEAGPGSEAFRELLARDWRPIDQAPVPRWHRSDDHLVVYGRI